VLLQRAGRFVLGLAKTQPLPWAQLACSTSEQSRSRTDAELGHAQTVIGTAHIKAIVMLAEELSYTQTARRLSPIFRASLVQTGLWPPPLRSGGETPPLAPCYPRLRQVAFGMYMPRFNADVQRPTPQGGSTHEHHQQRLPPSAKPLNSRSNGRPPKTSLPPTSRTSSSS